MGGRDHASASPPCWCQVCRGLPSMWLGEAATACRTGRRGKGQLPVLEKLVAFCPMPKDSLAQVGACLHRCPQHTVAA